MPKWQELNVNRAALKKMHMRGGGLEEFLEIELYKGLKQRQYSYQSLEYNKIMFKKL